MKYGEEITFHQFLEKTKTLKTIIVSSSCCIIPGEMNVVSGHHGGKKQNF